MTDWNHCTRCGGAVNWRYNHCLDYPRCQPNEFLVDSQYRVKVGQWLYFVRFDGTFPVFVIDTVPGVIEEHAQTGNKHWANNIINILGEGKLEVVKGDSK